MILARAPLRITLGGGGTDLPEYYERHGGFVVSAAIDKYVYICINRPAADALIRVKYSRYEEVAEVGQIQHDLVRAALDLLGISDNIEIVSLADVPAGTGLGSSSTYLVALLTALHVLKREPVSPTVIAELAFHVEKNLANHPVGKQDQYLAAMGGLMCLDIDRKGHVEVRPLRISKSATEELLAGIMLFFTGMSRTADAILEEQRRDSVNGNSEVIDSLHKTKELGLQIEDALLRGALEEFGELLDEHWQNKKRRSSQISGRLIDHWYETAREAGALGGKVVGAGGGGFLMLYCRNGQKPAVREALAAEGLRELAYGFEFQGAKVLVDF